MNKDLLKCGIYVSLILVKLIWLCARAHCAYAFFSRAIAVCAILKNGVSRKPTFDQFPHLQPSLQSFCLGMPVRSTLNVTCFIISRDIWLVFFSTDDNFRFRVKQVTKNVKIRLVIMNEFQMSEVPI